MAPRNLIPLALALAGAAAEGYAILCERRMQRFRLPGVSYWAATLRRDGGWQRTDLFAPEGLAWQRVAARFGVWGIALWASAAVAWAIALSADKAATRL